MQIRTEALKKTVISCHTEDVSSIEIPSVWKSMLLTIKMEAGLKDGFSTILNNNSNNNSNSNNRNGSNNNNCTDSNSGVWMEPWSLIIKTTGVAWRAQMAGKLVADFVATATAGRTKL